MSGAALSIYRRKFGALVLTCALALVPAQLVMSGAVVLGFAGLGAAGPEAPTHTEQIQKKKSDLHESPPAPEERGPRLQQLGREAFEGKSAIDAASVQSLFLFSAVAVCALAILLIGLFLAQAAVVPLALETSGSPAGAWAAVASRLPAVVWTALLCGPLIAAGAVFLLVPGVVLAVGFALAMPVVMREGLSGRAALERSWALSRGRRAAIFAQLFLIALITAAGSSASLLLPAGPWRAAISGAVRLLAYPLPLAALVLLYRGALNTSAGSRLPDSSARGSPGTLRP